MSPGEFADKLAVRAEAAGFTLPSELVEPLHSYYRLLTRWNNKINLTAINLHDLLPEAVDRLFIEPVAAARFAESGVRIIDIGSGGGSPAIPFALAAKGAFLAMVESRSRKSVFLQEAARAVALPAQVITSRYEDAIRQPELQMAFEVVTIRAVRVDEAALQRLAGFMKSNGSLFLFQTSEVPPPKGMKFNAHQLTANAMLQVGRLINVPRGT